jgi:hypothetical protein
MENVVSFEKGYNFTVRMRIFASAKDLSFFQLDFPYIFFACSLFISNLEEVNKFSSQLLYNNIEYTIIKFLGKAMILLFYLLWFPFFY